MIGRYVCFTPDAAATGHMGAALGRVLPPGTVVLLRGGLGAGKTTFVQGIARGLGIQDVIASPTFVLVRSYTATASPEHAGRRLVHADLYRLRGQADAADLGLDEDLAGGAIVAVEWPERAPGLWPADALDVAMGAVPASAGATVSSATLSDDPTRVGGDGPSGRDRDAGAIDANRPIDLPDAAGTEAEPRRLTFTARTADGAALIAAFVAELDRAALDEDARVAGVATDQAGATPRGGASR